MFGNAPTGGFIPDKREFSVQLSQFRGNDLNDANYVSMKMRIHFPSLEDWMIHAAQAGGSQTVSELNELRRLARVVFLDAEP